MLTRFNAFTWWGFAILAWGVARAAQVWLDGFYARSKFPVPFYVGQTRFDAVEVKGYYAHMLDQRTLGIYVQTQLVDYVFMAASLVFLTILGGAALRTLPRALHGTRLFGFAKAMVWVMPLAPVFDALENLVSFVMLANPTGFADWLALPYSAFAVMKFAVFAIGYLWAVACVLILAGYGAWMGVRRLCGLERKEAVGG
ncbi:hypothetical protein VDG1235_3262 [Verrucomicrobiia bacterium DG1235]|nr:hypothetical protein VDG1235_3262 [Verrucomicrobiae bacterium DG1235]